MRPALVAASLALFALTAAPVRAEGTLTHASDLVAAEKQLADGETELAATGGTCVTMCKALQSMMNAADRICALAKEGPPEDRERDQQRCTEARTKVADAVARVRAACPDCNPGPPLAPSTAAPVPKEPASADDPGAHEIQTTALAPPSADYRAHRAKTLVSVTVDPMRLFLPRLLVQLRFEKALSARFSLALAGAYGTLETQGSNGPGRASATMLGAEIRAYVLGRVDEVGLFVSAEINHRNAALFAEDHIVTRNFVLGLTAGPVVGVKLVTIGGFTLESRLGASYVIDDQRWAGAPRPRIVPNFGVGVGFSF